MKFVFNDGGRTDAGFRGEAGDCVARSIAIVTNKSYQELYTRLAEGNASQRASRGKKQSKSARNGIYTSRKWFKDLMGELGFEWVPTMGIGTGCQVHLTDGEVPNGRLVVSLSKHYTAVIDGIIHDTHDPQREKHHAREDDGSPLQVGEWRNDNGLICKITRRCVYGYWILK